MKAFFAGDQFLIFLKRSLKKIFMPQGPKEGHGSVLTYKPTTPPSFRTSGINMSAESQSVLKYSQLRI